MPHIFNSAFNEIKMIFWYALLDYFRLRTLSIRYLSLYGEKCVSLRLVIKILPSIWEINFYQCIVLSNIQIILECIKYNEERLLHYCKTPTRNSHLIRYISTLLQEPKQKNTYFITRMSVMEMEKWIYDLRQSFNLKSRLDVAYYTIF